MPKEKVNYQEVYDLYQLCSETKDLKELCSEYGVNYDKFMNSNWNLHLSPELTPDQIKVRQERRSKTLVSKETYDKRQLLPCYIKI